MQRRAVALAALAVCSLSAAACTSNSDSKDGKAVADTTTTTVAASSTTTAAAKAPDGPVTTPDAAAKGLFSAWQKGDRSDASRYARQRAIEALFAHPNTGDVEYASQGCDPQGGAFICSWTYPGGALQMSVEGVVGNSGYVVDNVTYIAD